jgi:hypothetical protein
MIEVALPSTVAIVMNTEVCSYHLAMWGSKAVVKSDLLSTQHAHG